MTVILFLQIPSYEKNDKPAENSGEEVEGF